MYAYNHQHRRQHRHRHHYGQDRQCPDALGLGL